MYLYAVVPCCHGNGDTFITMFSHGYVCSTVSQTMLVAVEYTEYDEGQGDGASELDARRKAMVNHVFMVCNSACTCFS